MLHGYGAIQIWEWRRWEYAKVRVMLYAPFEGEKGSYVEGKERFGYQWNDPEEWAWGLVTINACFYITPFGPI